MERSAHAQADKGAREEAREHQHVNGGCSAVPGHDEGFEKVEGGQTESREHDGPEEVGPDVDGLVVQAEKGGKGAPVAVAGLAVARVDEGVVAAPFGQVVPYQQQGCLNLLFDGLDGFEETVGGCVFVAPAKVGGGLGVGEGHG